MKEKYEQLRKCKEKTLCRDEIYEMFVKIGENYPEKKADDLFFTANQDNDATICCEEFIQLVRKEIEERNTKRYKFAQAIAKLKKSVNKARCSILVRWFQSDVKTSKDDKSEDKYHNEKLALEAKKITEFSEKIQKKTKSSNHSTFVMQGETSNHIVNDEVELEQLLHFFEIFGIENDQFDREDTD